MVKPNRIGELYSTKPIIISILATIYIIPPKKIWAFHNLRNLELL